MRKGYSSVVSWLFPQLRTRESSRDDHQENQSDPDVEIFHQISPSSRIASTYSSSTKDNDNGPTFHDIHYITEDEDIKEVVIVDDDDDEVQIINEVKSISHSNPDNKRNSYNQQIAQFKGFWPSSQNPQCELINKFKLRNSHLKSPFKGKKGKGIKKFHRKSRLLRGLKERGIYRDELQKFLGTKFPKAKLNVTLSSSKSSNINSKEFDIDIAVRVDSDNDYNSANDDVRVVETRNIRENKLLQIEDLSSDGDESVVEVVLDLDKDEVCIIDTESEYESEDEQYYNNKSFDKKECDIIFDPSVETDKNTSLQSNGTDCSTRHIFKEQELRYKLDHEKEEFVRDNPINDVAKDEVRNDQTDTISMSTDLLYELDKLEQNTVLAAAHNINITKSDIHTLYGLNWLNDEIINFYFAMIVAGNLENIYTFNTFFYPRLISGGHKAVSRWTRKVDIFSFKLLLIPIHLGIHWTLIAVNVDKELMKMTYYDSMRGGDPGCLDALEQYLVTEMVLKKGQVLQVEKIEAKDCPLQLNGSDCGVFICQNAKRLAQGLGLRDLDQQNMPHHRRKMISEIVNNTLDVS